jgi:hypothetical protein
LQNRIAFRHLQYVQFAASLWYGRTKTSPLACLSMIRIHVANHAEADAAWRMLTHVPDRDWQPIELYLDGHGPLYQAIRTEAGDQSATPPAAAPGRSCPA